MGPEPSLTCDVRSLPADVCAVDLLARLGLAARRRGRRLRLSGASEDLRELLELVGLAEVLPLDAES